MSSADTVVFAQRFESSFEKQLLTARAKRERRVHDFLESANLDAKTNFWNALAGLNKMLRYYATVSERLLLFFDNNVIQDILKRDDETCPLRGHRFHALLAFLILAEDYYCLDIFACVSPAVLYEASGRGECSTHEVETQVRSLMAEIGLAMHAVGYFGTKELAVLFKRIRRDENTLRSALNEIRSKSWNRDFAGDYANGIRIPFSLAEEECPKVHLVYFQPWYVKLILMHAIEKRMFDSNDDRKARGMMRNPQEKAFSILKVRGDGVEGLGDIELLTCCDLASQTNARSPDITMGVTFDEGLRAALWERSSVRSSASMCGGVDDVRDSSLRFAYMLRESTKRTDKANKRAVEYDQAMKEFLKPLEKHFVGSESCKRSHTHPVPTSQASRNSR